MPVLASSSMSVGTLPATNMNTASPQIVLSQKSNIDLKSLLASNKAIDSKVEKMLAIQGQAIDAYFKAHDMPLEGMGRKMAEEANKNGLDWRLVPAIAVRESTGGKDDCNKVKFNPFGWGSCKIGFKSTEEAIETIARNLGGNNPNTARHYDNKSTLEILRAYNPPSIVPRYAQQVMSIMNTIGDIDLGEDVNV